MPFRFRKSIKIAPGVRMNIGKRGVSSIGVGNLNFGRRGVYSNISIPGTGISYRSQIVGRSQTSATPPKTQQPKSTKEMAVTLKLQDDGSVIFTDEKGKPLPDHLTREAKKQNKELILQWLQEQRAKYNAEIEAVLRIHLTTPSPSGDIIVNPKPEPPTVETHGLMSKLFGRQRQKVDERNQRAHEEYQEALRQWERAEHALRRDTEVMSAVLSNAFASIEWPRETFVSFDIIEGGRTVLVDVDLPEIEDMPTQEAQVSAKELRLTIKERSQTQRQLDYLTHIHAIGFRFIGEVFAQLPAVTTVVLSGYSQRVSKKTGNIEDEYLYSVRIPRAEWEKINFANLEAIDVVACFERFELRRNATKRGSISPIEPFQT